MEVLGIGVSHYPGLKYPDDHMANILKQIMESPFLPDELRTSDNWPRSMREEWGEDQGAAAAVEHRRRNVEAFRVIRNEILRFQPDFILMWGDDQYENFREDIIPPFCVSLYEDTMNRPYLKGSAITRGTNMIASIPNVWNEPLDQGFLTRIHREGGRYMVDQLLERGVNIPYAFKPLHDEELGHAFVNALLYLDYDREGFDIPIVPFNVNCYGTKIMSGTGGIKGIIDPTKPPSPPGPTPKSCFELGAAVREVLEASPWRVVIMGSSGWSHSFLSTNTHWLYPDVESDRQRLHELEAGEFFRWKELTNREIEAAGEHEMRNWFCLAGAMQDRKAEIVDYVETYVFNSNKCYAIFR